MPFLRERVREALAAADRARAALSEDADEASHPLDEARLTLRRLDEYYLPLLAARQQVARAARSVAVDEGAARAAVDSAEAALMGIVRGHGRPLEEEMREPLERLQDVRTALGAGDVSEARRILPRLGAHLESIFFRGALVLEGSDLDPGPGSSHE